MTDTANALPQIPGLDMVGRGVYLRPQQPFELKDVLFRQADHQVDLDHNSGHWRSRL